MRVRSLHLLSALFLLLSVPASAQAWQSHLKDQLALMGHRNWILIVDSAYPQQVGPGIETIETNADQLEVVRSVLGAIKGSIHVRPLVFMDAELAFVPEEKAPGVENYRRQIASLLRDYNSQPRPHQSLIDEVGKDSNQYRVLILKTQLAVPYTSVFIHLDCKYWSADDERDLRARMSSHASQ